MKKFFVALLTIVCLLGNGGSSLAASTMPDWLQTGGISAANKNSGTAVSGSSSAGVGTASSSGTIKWSNGNVLSNIRYGDGTARLRIVLDMSQAPDYTVVKENNGSRLVVNMNNISTAMQEAPATKSSVIKDIILGSYGGDTLQLIVDMQAALDVKVSTMKNPNRLVIDIQKEYEQEDHRSIAQGLEYTKYVRVDGRGMLTAYLLEADRSKFDLKLVLAGGNISSGRQRMKAMVAANNAIAGINGGYFSTDGSLIGNTRIKGKTAGTTYYTRTSLGFMPDNTLKFATSQYYGEVNVNGKKVFLSGVNCPRGENNTTLYNSLFGSYTGTNEYGMEYIIQDGKVVAINQSNSFIPANGQVISVHGTAREAFAQVKIGDKVTIGENFGDELNAAENIVGAGPELLRNGQVNVTATQEQFPSDIAKGRAPRTAVGIKADGKVLLLVVDGRQSHSIGTTLTETAQLLQKFGAVNAFNLDGGGSSEMVLQGQIVNSPSDGSERPVGSGLMLIQR